MTTLELLCAALLCICAYQWKRLRERPLEVAKRELEPQKNKGFFVYPMKSWREIERDLGAK